MYILYIYMCIYSFCLMCIYMQMRMHVHITIYLYKSVANWKVSGNLKASLKGFHLGVLIYLVLAPVFLGVLLFIFFNY